MLNKIYKDKEKNVNKQKYHVVIMINATSGLNRMLHDGGGSKVELRKVSLKKSN